MNALGAGLMVKLSIYLSPCGKLYPIGEVIKLGRLEDVVLNYLSIYLSTGVSLSWSWSLAGR